MRAIQFLRTGGPEVLQLVELAEPEPDAKGLLVDVHAAGVNFIDIYFRSGAYPAALPCIPGDEGVGIVRAVGAEVSGFSPGDRVAWTGGKAAYAEVAVAPSATAIKLPDALPDEAGFVIAQGLTAHYLANDIGMLGTGSVALVHAAAGGVGSLLTRLLASRGVRVIGTVSSEAKAAAVRATGINDVIVLEAGRSFADRVRALTHGDGVDITYDGVGLETFAGSLASIRPRGTLVLYGASSGPVTTIDPAALARGGSISFIRPRLGDYIATPAEFQMRINALLRALLDGQLEVNIGGRFPLAQAADAHRALEGRTSHGKLILTMGTETVA